MPQRSLPLAIVALLALTPTPAVAGDDELWGTRGDGQMSEQEHRIELSFERGYATMVVHRTVHNGYEEADEAAWGIALPDRAVATGLRLLGEQRGKPKWFVGELLPADEAATRYHELTGMDPDHHPSAGVRDPALLAWDYPGALSLQVFPVAAGGDTSVEYTLDMPVSWVDGRWELELLATGVDGLPARLELVAANARDRLFVDGQGVERGHELALDRSYRLALVPNDHQPLELELASLDTGAGRAFVHWRASLSSELSQLPTRARIVVALDLSRSLDPEAREAMREAALAYLEHFRDPGTKAEVAVLGFDHRIRPLTDGWVSPRVAIGALRGASLESDNGSAVELALSEAERLFASAPARAPRRVLLLTDFRTASRRAVADYEAAARASGAVVHLAEVRAGGPWLARDDHHGWASVAASTQGVVWTAAVPLADEDDQPGPGEEAIEVFEEWARPLRIDGLEFDLGPEAPELTDLPTSLAEGEGIDEQLLAACELETLAVRGRMWNTPVEYDTRRDGALSRRWAGLVFGAWIHEELDDDEMQRLASRGGAVSPVTSYLAVEPGARPTSAGIVRDEANFGLIGRAGCGGTGSGYGAGYGVGFGGRLDRQTWLEDELGARWLRCGGAGRELEVELEATYEELVDFEFALLGAADPALVTCMREATWSVWLPATDFVDERSRWTVTLG